MITKFLDDIKRALKEAIISLGLPTDDLEIVLEVPKDATNGDYATNVAMRLARAAHKAPVLIAQDIVSKLDLASLHVKDVNVAGAGFINFTIDLDYLLEVIGKVLNDDNYGSNNIGNGQKIDLEFVSANPTGYLHVGHGRGAAYGDSLANVLEKCGYVVTREHYVNDAGNQITNMAKSVYERYKELFGLPFELDDDMYHGKEIIKIAEKLRSEYDDKYLNNFDLDFFREYGTKILLGNLQQDLAKFNVHFDVWFSEKSLYASHAVENVIKKLTSDGYTYVEDGATFLKTSLYGDEKDRVIIKSDGSYTYLLPDIAYHANKLSRGYDHLIDVLGADHHGYIPRLKAAIKFMGKDPNKLDVEILQMVRVLENGEEVKMSKRSGKAITLRDLITEVGPDALRFMYSSKSLSTHMDLDIDLMKKNTNENPVYYVQYAYARISGLFRTLKENGKEFEIVKEFKDINFASISKIVKMLLQYPTYLLDAAEKRIPHKMIQYAINLATVLHSYYNDEKIIDENINLTNEKLTLLKSVQIVLKNCLNLVGVNVKERM